VKLLLKAKADVKMQGKDGGIDLGVAVNRNKELAKQLLNAKSDVQAQSKDGELALGVVVNGDTELAKQLLDAEMSRCKRKMEGLCRVLL
jgi:ankyrin repeat protein